MQYIVGLLIGLIIGSMGLAIAQNGTIGTTVMRKFQCPEAVWASSIHVFPSKAEPFVADLGFCPDGIVMWRSAMKESITK